MPLKHFLPCFSALLLLSFLAASPALAARLNADAFLPPVQAESDQQEAELTKIQEPAAVQSEKDGGLGGLPIVKAASAQDAINAAAGQIEQQGGSGCSQISFPSGLGWVSMGSAAYSFMKNPTATTIAQRNAYVIAYTHAKKELAQTLHGLTSSGATSLAEEMKTLTTSQKDLANLNSALKEGTEELVKGMIRGYVLYNVSDKQDASTGTVSVTIVTTPKTMGEFKRPDPDSLSADSLRDGLNHVLGEMANGLIPPVGGKTIFVPQTGELAFIGFGSAVVHQNSNPAMQQKLFLNANKIAQMRARSALLGILKGDDIESASKESEETVMMSQAYEEAMKEDPTTGKSEKEYRELEQGLNTFKNTSAFSEAISSLRKGTLPPGVKCGAIPNPEKTLITGYAIYVPGITRQAEKAAEKMRTVSPMGPAASSGTPSSGTASSGGGGSIGFDVKEGGPVSQGATGQVTHDKDL